MRIVIAGGTGFVGRAVVARLLEEGRHELALTTRDPGGRDPWRGRVQRLQAFAGDRVSLGRAFTRADVVVQCVQFPNHPVENPSRGYTYMQVDGRGTQIAVEVARRVGVRRFVYLSGAGAGQGRSQPWFHAKDLAEAALRGSGLEAVVLRPSWIYGPGDRSMSRFVWFCRHLPCVPVIGDGRNRVDPVYIDDVARCVAESALREDAAGQTFELGGPQRLTTDEILRTIQRLIGRRRPLVHHPARLMKLLVRPLQLLPEPPLTPQAIDFLLQEVELDPRPAARFFGAEFLALEEGLRRCLQVA
jgi:NADH dehydrogenase